MPSLRFMLSLTNCQIKPDYPTSNFTARKVKDEIAFPPCEKCDNKKTCSSKKLACKAYAVWVDSRIPNPEDSRVPNQATYNRLFANKHLI